MSALTDLRSLEVDNRERQSNGALAVTNRQSREKLRESPLTDDGLASLASLTRLEILQLRLDPTERREVSAQAVAQLISGMPRLEVLELYGLPGSRARLDELRALRELKVGSVGDGVPLLADLKRLPELRKLGLTGGGLSDLDFLRGMAGLIELDLGGNPIFDGQLKHLYGLTGLRKLNLSYTRVTDAGISTLKRALPDVQIESFQLPGR